METDTRARWNYPLLIKTHVALVLLISSFFLPPTASLWSSVETKLFFLLNGSLELSPSWARFWAMANHRSERHFMPFFLAAVNVFYLCFHRQKSLLYTLSQFLFFWLCMELVIPLMNLFILKGLDIHRKSPTYVLKPAVLLSSLFEDSMIRDRSSNSFHSGHAFNKTFWAAFTVYICHSRTYKVLAVAIAIALSIPRLFSGGHWLSDIVFAVVMALTVISWIMGSPIKTWGVRRIHLGLQRLFPKRAENLEVDPGKAG